MNTYEYRVSVIVPVCNTEKYLKGCLNSLLTQTIDQDEMEVLLIDDGSTDASLKICEEYSRRYECFKIFSQHNAGVSAARNLGIDNARGKYIMFLDSDDSLSPETLKSVTDFFDSVYRETDVVTYPEVKILENVRQPSHFRYKYLKDTGIYRLDDCIYATVSRVNIAVKNHIGNNRHFDIKLEFAEDQEYIFGQLKEKMTVGFVNGGTYFYNLRKDSVVATSGYSYYFWESVVENYYEKLFDSYKDGVPKYLQAMFLYDSSWKIRKDQFFPYHYEKDKYEEAVNRIIKILNQIDDDVILEHPGLDFYHKFYLFKLKRSPVAFYSDNESYRIILNGKVIKEDTMFEAVIVRFVMKNGELRILGHLKSVIFDFTEKPELFAVVNGKYVNVDLFESTRSRYKTKIKTNKFWGFYFTFDDREIKKLEFRLRMDMCEYPVKFWFMPTSPFNSALEGSDYYSDGRSASLQDCTFVFDDMTEEAGRRLIVETTEKISSSESELYRLRISAVHHPDKPVWLYYDCGGVDKDNGYYQFIHDFEKDDGIERYYVNNNARIAPGLFKEEHMSHVIKFGSSIHKDLFIHCDKVITAFAERDNIFPFGKGNDGVYADILNFDVIYLQHGILHASIPWKYTPESLRIDKVVVSSYFEAENFREKYKFRDEDILRTGMPRFLHLDREAKPGNRILFAPSWRNYLITPQVKNYWAPLTDRFVSSDYFKKICAFINSERLRSYLKEHDLCIEFKLHPIFYKAYRKCFSLDNETVVFADNSVRDEDYCAFVTDFSSFTFDFAYLKRPIIYFVPDYLQVKSGMNQYRELDLPFDKAFGKLVKEPEDAVDELIRIADNGFKPEKQFSDRMDSFFLPMQDCEEKLYQYLMQGNRATDKKE